MAPNRVPGHGLPFSVDTEGSNLDPNPQLGCLSAFTACIKKRPVACAIASLMAIAALATSFSSYIPDKKARLAVNVITATCGLASVSCVIYAWRIARRSHHRPLPNPLSV